MKSVLCVLIVVLVGALIGYGFTPYITHSLPYGFVLHPIGCVLYSLQYLCWLGAWHATRGKSHWVRVASLSVTAISAEYVLARIFSPIWILSNPVLLLVNTPLVQWIDRLSVFGLSAILYTLIFATIPRTGVKGWYRGKIKDMHSD